jgi:hypothetical protein
MDSFNNIVSYILLICLVNSYLPSHLKSVWVEVAVHCLVYINSLILTVFDEMVRQV